jgi:hypothetical protein
MCSKNHVSGNPTNQELTAVVDKWIALRICERGCRRGLERNWPIASNFSRAALAHKLHTPRAVVSFVIEM